MALLSLLVIHFSISTLAVPFSATQLNSSLAVNTSKIYPSTLRLFNISITNFNQTTGSVFGLNITTINITLPEGFTFVNGTNTTTGPANTTFTTYGQNISWNTSSGNLALIASNATHNFSFKAIAATGEGTYNLTITAQYNDTTVALNTSVITIRVTGLVSSSNRSFSTDTNSLRLNWSNGTVLVETNNATFSQVFVENQTTNVTPVYFTTSDYGVSAFSGFSSGNRVICFGSGTDTGMDFTVFRGPTATNVSQLLNETNVTAFSLFVNEFCPPGLYRGTVAIRNVTNESERIHLPIVVHISINANNTFVPGNNTASFLGNGSGGDNSFFFFTNMSQNSGISNLNLTTVTINVSGLSGDVDLFLLNDTEFLASSINNGSLTEEVTLFLPANGTGKLWEIRLANTSSSYTGRIFFATINVTNMSNTLKEVRKLVFGEAPLKPNETNRSFFRLKNMDDVVLAGLVETREIYNIKRFLHQTSPQQVDFIVPNFTTKIKVRLEWDNVSGIATDWDLFLTSPNGTTQLNSTTKAGPANASNLHREEFIIFEGPFHPENQGIWNVSVINVSQDSSLNPYNLSLLVYLSESAWLNSSFNLTTLNASFNSSSAIGPDADNMSHNVTATVTVPRYQLLNGTYEGFFTYSNGSGWKVKLPFTFDVAAGILLVNGNFSNSTTLKKTDNIGYDKNISVSVQLNNTGGSMINFTNTSSNITSLAMQLALSTDSTKTVNVSIAFMPNGTVNANSQNQINLTFNVTMNSTVKAPGLYVGWLVINSSNVTNVSASSYPYDIINISFELNLTDRLNTTISKISTRFLTMTDGNPLYAYVWYPQNESANISLQIRASLANGSFVSVPGPSEGGIANVTNFTTVWIVETNRTDYSVTLTDIKASYSALCEGDEASTQNVCNINASIPNTTIGGRYRVYTNISWHTNQSNSTATSLFGTGSNDSLVINETGLNLTAVTTPTLGSINEATGTAFINVTVANFGPLPAVAATLTFNKGNCPVTVTADSSGQVENGGSQCSSITNDNPFTFTIGKEVPTGCWFRFKLTAQNVTSTTACSSMNVTASRATYANVTGITLTVTETGGSTTSSTTSSSSSSSSTTCSTNAGCAANQACVSSTCTALDCTSSEYIEDHACVGYDVNIDEYPANLSVVAGETVTAFIKVSEGNAKTISTKLETLIDNISTSIDHETCTTPCNFTVTFTTTATTKVAHYDGTFKAYPSFATDASTSQSFTFSVAPNEQQKAEIQEAYANLTPTADALESQVAALITAGQIPADQVDEITGLVDKMASLKAQIQAALDAGDYITANELIEELQATILEIQGKINPSGAGGLPFAFDTSLIIIVVVIIGVAAVLVYLMLPARRGFSSGKGFRSPEKKGFSLFKRSPKPPRAKEEKITKYASGYDRFKPASGYTAPKSGVFGRLFKKKKAQRRLGEFR
ncbi:MAG: hypothetical protein HY369_02005 [Candidatus Aenigmarchaeota archaeon]|nr:hypothetical protein [Candidatus Aenigmarchaeota archaeon]